MTKNLNPIFALMMLFLIAIPIIGTGQTLKHPGGLHTKSQIELVRNKIHNRDSSKLKAYNLLIEQVILNLDKEPQAMTNFDVPGYYENPELHRANMAKLSDDAWTAYSCAIAYQLTESEERINYADKALQILMNWAETNKKISNIDGRLAMVDAGAGLVMAAELIYHFKEWKAKDKRVFNNWLKNVYIKSCQSIEKEPNNWGLWGIYGNLLGHHFLNEEAELIKYSELLKSRIDADIAADGSMPEEVKRGKRGLWYTYFALAPIAGSCEIIKHSLSIDLFHFKGKDGAGVKNAVEYLFKYSLKPELWPHYSDKDLNKGNSQTYPGNLFEALDPIFPDLKLQKYTLQSKPIMVFGHHYVINCPSLLPFMQE